MITMKKLTEEDFQKYGIIFHVALEQFNAKDGRFYKFDYDGGENILLKKDSLFAVFYFSEDGVGIEYECFEVDENYNIIRVAFNDYLMETLNDGSHVLVDYKTDIVQSMCLAKRENGNDIDGYDGVVLYTQYDSKTDKRVTISYQQMYNQAGRVYPFHIDKPFEIQFESQVNEAEIKNKKCKNVSYIRSDFNSQETPLFYTLAAMKEYGVGAVLSSGAENLVGCSKFFRYSKILGVTKNYQAITAFPLTPMYTLDDMFKKIREEGFNTEIPQFLLDFNNDDIEDYKAYQELAFKVKEIDELTTGLEHIVTLELKRGDEDGQNN